MKTIALKEKTFGMLLDVKRELEAKTFEEAITKLVEKMKKVPRNMFGIDQRMKSFTEKEEMEFEGE